MCVCVCVSIRGQSLTYPSLYACVQYAGTKAGLVDATIISNVIQ
jgi:hypothetical protein